MAAGGYLNSYLALCHGDDPSEFKVKVNHNFYSLEGETIT